MSESFISDEELREHFAQKVEQLALEYHNAIRKYEGIEDAAFVTGVEFLLTFDIKAYLDDKVVSANYGLLGNQTYTTSLGMAIRAAHLVDDLDPDGPLED